MLTIKTKCQCSYDVISDIPYIFNGIHLEVLVVPSLYDTASTYALYAIVAYNGVLYRCTTAEAWNAAHWTATTVAQELVILRQSVVTINSNLVYKLV